MRFDPPRLTIGPLSGDVFVVTHGKTLGHDEAGRERIEATRKYVVTDQFDALASQRDRGKPGEDRLTGVAETAVHAFLGIVPVSGSWQTGYRVNDCIDSTLHALPEEWADAAQAVSDLHAALTALDERQGRRDQP